MQNKVINTQTIAPNGLELNSINEEKIHYLEARIIRLGEICNELNPYQPISDDFKKSLREFNILEFEDPFKITNALLILLEDTIDELHILKPLTPEEDLIEKYR